MLTTSSNEEESKPLTRAVKDYKKLKQWANRFLFMTLIISVAAIIIGVGTICLFAAPKPQKIDPKNTDHKNTIDVKNTLGKNKNILFKESIIN